MHGRNAVVGRNESLCFQAASDLVWHQCVLVGYECLVLLPDVSVGAHLDAITPLVRNPTKYLFSIY